MEIKIQKCLGKEFHHDWECLGTVFCDKFYTIKCKIVIIKLFKIFTQMASTLLPEALPVSLEKHQGKERNENNETAE